MDKKPTLYLFPKSNFSPKGTIKLGKWLDRINKPKVNPVEPLFKNYHDSGYNSSNDIFNFPDHLIQTNFVGNQFLQVPSSRKQ